MLLHAHKKQPNTPIAPPDTGNPVGLLVGTVHGALEAVAWLVRMPAATVLLFPPMCTCRCTSIFSGETPIDPRGVLGGETRPDA